jgi:hypothetical protein
MVSEPNGPSRTSGNATLMLLRSITHIQFLRRNSIESTLLWNVNAARSSEEAFGYSKSRSPIRGVKLISAELLGLAAEDNPDEAL